MEKSYPDKYTPASMFELDKASEGLRKISLRIPYGTLREFDKHRYLYKLAEYISEVIGHPSQLLHEQLPQWDSAYRSLWTPVLRWYYANSDIENADKVYKSYLAIRNIMVSDGFKDRLGLEGAHQLAEEYSDAVESPWIRIFIWWDVQGRKQYIVSRGLCEKLRKTVLKGYPTESFKLPYDSIYIDLRSYGEFAGYDLTGCIVWYEGETFKIILATEGESAKFPRIVQVELKYETLEAALEANFQEFEVYDEVVQDWRALFSYIINVILYATMPDCESEFQYYDPSYEKTLKKLRKHPKGSQKYKKAKAKLGRIDKAGYDYLGGSIRVDRSGDRESSGESQETGRKLTVRTLVSGHWRDQPCGAGRRDIKRIWIEPFWRGPEGVPITHRPHSLK